MIVDLGVLVRSLPRLREGASTKRNGVDPDFQKITEREIAGVDFQNEGAVVGVGGERCLRTDSEG